ncbi:hypothetical protein AURDEDRAFT_125310 [Auricularia subglabra TFB-10046 SS5]|nr:hypothetical protein AURDEDRAFT_125310 [Auricularia subglabra TFB-10046 SS5]
MVPKDVEGSLPSDHQAALRRCYLLLCLNWVRSQTGLMGYGERICVDRVLESHILDLPLEPEHLREHTTQSFLDLVALLTAEHENIDLLRSRSTTHSYAERLRRRLQLPEEYMPIICELLDISGRGTDPPTADSTFGGAVHPVDPVPHEPDRHPALEEAHLSGQQMLPADDAGVPRAEAVDLAEFPSGESAHSAEGPAAPSTSGADDAGPLSRGDEAVPSPPRAPSAASEPQATPGVIRAPLAPQHGDTAIHAAAERAYPPEMPAEGLPDTVRGDSNQILARHPGDHSDLHEPPSDLPAGLADAHACIAGSDILRSDETAPGSPRDPAHGAQSDGTCSASAGNDADGAADGARTRTSGESGVMRASPPLSGIARGQDPAISYSEPQTHGSGSRNAPDASSRVEHGLGEEAHARPPALNSETSPARASRSTGILTALRPGAAHAEDTLPLGEPPSGFRTEADVADGATIRGDSPTDASRCTVWLGRDGDVDVSDESGARTPDAEVAGQRAHEAGVGGSDDSQDVEHDAAARG